MLEAIFDPAFNGADLLFLALLVAGLWKLRPRNG